MKALLFDYGGTLDTGARHWYYVIHEAYAHCGLEHIDDASLRAAYVHGERMLARNPIVQPEDDFRTLLLKKMREEVSALEASGHVTFKTEAARERLCSQLADYCDAYARQHVNQARPLLEGLSETHRLVLVTNFYGNIDSVLRAYGLRDLFSAIVESATCGVRKPAPGIWQLGVEETGCSAADCVAIGDSFTKDIAPAAAVGCKTIWFEGEEWEEKSYDRTLPTWIVHSLGELGEVLGVS